MSELFLFFARFRAFILFVLLEIFSLWCMFRFNNYGSAVLFNTTSNLVAKVVTIQNAIVSYTKLNEVNEALAMENVRLNTQITKLQNIIPKDNLNSIDSSVINRYSLQYAEAINFTINQRNNYITIDKGTKDGVEVGMGVISSTGIVGRVKMCSANMSLVTSILHSENLVSSKLKKTNKLGSVKWDGVNSKEVEMLYVDLYEQIQKGDSVVTSDLNSVYPGNILVGTVKEVLKSSGSQFLKIRINLSTDFKNLAYVYIVKNALIEEQKTLEASISNQKK